MGSLTESGPLARFFFGVVLADIARLQAMMAEQLAALGYELVECRLQSGQQGPVLSVLGDHPEGFGLKDCETVSRHLSALLDEDDFGLDKYRLEVSSPGIERPLTKKAHFERFCGETVKVQTQQPIDGRKNYRGELIRVDGDAVVVLVDTQEYLIPLAEIHRARIVKEF